jgi:hypothetical protein
VNGRRRPLWYVTLLLVAVGCVKIGACPSQAGGSCDPRDANCPTGYVCAIAEVCTRTCDQSTDCWIKVTDGCRSNDFPGMALPDGGTYIEDIGDGYCSESKSLICLEGYCQKDVCATLDGGCDYDVYGPSPFKGNRSQGPSQ